MKNINDYEALQQIEEIREVWWAEQDGATREEVDELLMIAGISRQTYDERKGK